MLKTAALTALAFVVSVAGCASTETVRESFQLSAAVPAGDGAGCAAQSAATSLPEGDAKFMLGKLNGYSLMRLADETPQELVKAARVPDTHPAIHGPYSIAMLVDFIAPRKKKLDEAYGIDTRFVIRAFESIYLGGTLGYARMKNEDREGLIKGEIQRYTTVFWCEYRFRLGDTTWSPSVDVAIGPGWFFGEPVPLAERRQAIESTGSKLRVSMISNPLLRLSVQFRIPVHRSTDISISEGNADVVIGIGTEFGEGKARYTITDFTAVTKTISKGALALDAIHLFAGLSFRF